MNWWIRGFGFFDVTNWFMKFPKIIYTPGALTKIIFFNRSPSLVESTFVLFILSHLLPTFHGGCLLKSREIMWNTWRIVHVCQYSRASTGSPWDIRFLGLEKTFVVQTPCLGVTWCYLDKILWRILVTHSCGEFFVTNFYNKFLRQIFAANFCDEFLRRKFATTSRDK